MICSSLCRVPFIAVLLSWFGRTHILDGPVFGGWVITPNGISHISQAQIGIRSWRKNGITLKTLYSGGSGSETLVKNLLHIFVCLVTAALFSLSFTLFWLIRY